MNKIEQIITQNFDIWSSAVKSKSSVGRGSSSKIELYGVKKLRELILDLAVRGLLVPQDPNDEPASELLKKIVDEKAKLIKEGKIKKEKPLEPIKEDDIPFVIPNNWVYSRLNDVIDVRDGTHDSPKDAQGNDTFPLITSKNFTNGKIDFENARRISKQDHIEICKRSLVEVDDILFSMIGGNIGNQVIVIDSIPFSIKNVALFKYYKKNFTYPKFIKIYTEELAIKLQEKASGGAQPFVSLGFLRSLIIALPPVEEQKRIVSKVDELMNLCDTLEKEQTNNIESHQTLVQFFLDSLINSKDSDSFDFAWKRISDNFDLLFTTEWSIDQLKQTILQLAVMGKLVKQDPNDESASDLLKKIASEKAKLIKEGKIKKDKPLEPIKEDDIPFVIPNNWEWCKLSEICFLITDGTHHTPTYTENGVPFLSVKDVSGGYLDFSNTRFISKEEHEILKKRCNPEFEDILFTKVGTTGIAKVIDKKIEFSIFVSLSLLKISKNNLYPYFIEYLLNSPFVKKQSDNNTMGIGNKNLVLKYIKEFLISLPPLEEQKRIVAKVDELMTLCDTLKEKIKSSQELQIKLAEVFTHPC